jgi:ABC-type nitrate/sulfonate/bicarbonate transport system ATPase subunit
METTPAVALKEVTFSFAERLPLLGRKDPQPHQVLGPLNDATREGQITAILGPSGCGKSTLLRLIAGLLQPVSGLIERVADADHMAFIFQDPTLLPWATVTENIALPLRLKGYSREQREATACLWAERVGLHDALDRRPAELSGGMRMRVSLARAFPFSHDLSFLMNRSGPSIPSPGTGSMMTSSPSTHSTNGRLSSSPIP